MTLTTNEAIRNALYKVSNKPFSYGELDCCLFVAEVVKEITGVDYSESFIGKYNSDDEASKIIESYGSIKNLVSSILGEPQDWDMNGSPTLLELPSIGETLGIYIDSKVLVKCESGTVFFPMRFVIARWPQCLTQ